MVVIINNLTNEDWQIIKSALRSEANNNVMSEIFPKRQERILELIKKIER